MRAVLSRRACVVVLAAAAGVAGAAETRVAVQASGKTFQVQPLVPAGEIQVRVIGPNGYVFERVVRGGQGASLSLSDGVLADGSYSYELTVAPLEKRVCGRAAVEGAAVGFVESGGFQVAGGAIVLPAGAAEPAAAPRPRTPGPSPEDMVFPDDVIVQGSLCVGLDCVNNEDFDFDSLRLKENNTRIQFNDTSVGAFPTNNWQIRANDSASGGQSFLGFVDQGSGGIGETGTVVFGVQSGAGANALWVSSGGRVGLGTNAPVLDLHVKSSNTPALRLEQDNSAGFTAQTWDIGSNESSFFVRDVTSGSRLPFRIQPGAATNSLIVADDSSVGVGTLSPTKPLHVFRSDGTAQVFVQETAAAVATRTLMQLTNNGTVRYNLANTATGISWAVDNATNQHYEVNNIGNPGVELSLDQVGNLVLAGTITAPSDRNAKADIVDVDPQDVLAKVAALPISTWRYKQDSQRHMGPMAQDFAAAFGLGQDDKHIALNDLSGVALAAIQALQRQNAELLARVAALEAAREQASPAE